MIQGPRHRHQAGFALVVSLLILVVLTLLGVSMFSNVGLQQRMAGNTREKTRAFHAAQTALQYGEWWLTQQASNPPQGSTCGSLTTTPVVCTNALTSINPSYPTQVPWTVGITYVAPVNGQLTVSATGGVNTYYSHPQFYIQYLGPNHDLGGTAYRVTAWARGGNSNSVAVVQSIYLLDAASGNYTPAVSLSGS